MKTKDLLVAEKSSVIQQKVALIQRLQSRMRILERRGDALCKRVARKAAQKSYGTAVFQPNNSNIHGQRALKDGHGAFLPEIRNLIRQLAGEQVSTERIGLVICYVAKAFGLEVIDLLSARSVSRIVLEGLLQSKIQIAMEISNTSCTYLQRRLRIVLIFLVKIYPSVAMAQE